MRTTRLRLALALTGAFAGAAVAVNPATGPAPAQAAPMPLESYKIMTYNIQDLPTIADHQDAYGIPDDKRMELIADRLGSSGYDVIAFNELMGDDSEIVLERLHSSGYTTILDDFDGDSDPGDSGLGLASKWEIVSHPVSGGECYYQKDHRCLAAYHMYTTAAGADDYAAKGIVFTRLRNPATGLPLGVFFTHLQASDEPEEESENQLIRGQQIAEALEFINFWAVPGEDVVVMGDLNIRGDGSEYGLRILNNFGSAGFKDAFRSHGSAQDVGFTRDFDRNSVLSGTGGERLDYILYRPRTQNSMCFQHTEVIRGYRYEGTHGDAYINTDLSDHYPLGATIAATAPHCRPDAALTDPADGEHTLAIQKRGGYLWLKYANPGTYSFRTANPQQPLEVKVYRDTDLSEPVESWAGGPHLVTQTGERYSNEITFDMNTPFYVRIRAINVPAPFTQSAWTGTFKFISDKHNGVSFEDAIVLDPFERLTQVQMSNQVAGPATKVHYALKQERLYHGGSQHLTFNTTEHTLAAYRITVFDGNKQPLPGLQTGYDNVEMTLDVPAAGSPVSGEAQTLYFTVDRLGCEGVCLSTYDVSWTTDYRKADLSQFHVYDLNDAPELTENDEPSVFVSVDGGPEVEIYLGTIDEGGSRHLPGWARNIGFTTSLSIRAVENDDQVDDPSHTVTYLAADMPFDTTDPYHTSFDLWPYDDNDQSDQDGQYRLWLTACRDLTKC